MGFSTTGLAHSGEDLKLAHVVFDDLRTIVPEARVEPLAEELDGRLRAICVPLRHIKVIDEAHGLQFCVLRLEFVLSPTIEVGFNHLLRPVGGGTGREVDGEGELELVEFSEERLLNQHGLADTRVTHEEDVFVVLEQSLSDETVPRPIDGLNVDLVELAAL